MNSKKWHKSAQQLSMTPTQDPVKTESSPPKAKYEHTPVVRWNIGLTWSISCRGYPAAALYLPCEVFHFVQLGMQPMQSSPRIIERAAASKKPRSPRSITSARRLTERSNRTSRRQTGRKRNKEGKSWLLAFLSPALCINTQAHIPPPNEKEWLSLALGSIQ